MEKIATGIIPCVRNIEVKDVLTNKVDTLNKYAYIVADMGSEIRLMKNRSVNSITHPNNKLTTDTPQSPKFA